MRLLDTLPKSFRQSWWARPEDKQTLTELIAVLTADNSCRNMHKMKQEKIEALFAAANIKHKSDANSTRVSEQKPVDTKKKRVPKCFVCGEKGHVKKNCRKNKNKKSQNKDSQGAGSSYGAGDFAFVMETESAEEQETWLMDSGAINHYSFHREWFVS